MSKPILFEGGGTSFATGVARFHDGPGSGSPQDLIFLSPDWPGGNFIGYEGVLDRIRFAVDPHRNRFYFSSI